jgi:steroid delta-isomerase-like uncharacterized protein
MSIQDNIKLNEAVIAAINAHDLEKYKSYYTDDALVTDLGNPAPQRGKEAVGKELQAYLTAFPDFKLMVKNQVVSEDQFAAEVEFSGTNSGPIQMAPDAPAIPATGKKVTAVQGTFFVKIRNNKVYELHVYSDIAGVMMQLGLMPMAAGR